MGLQPACKMSSLPPSPASRNPQMFPAQRVFSLSHQDRPKTQVALGKATAPKPSSETQTAQGHGRRGCSFGFQPAGSISNRENASTARKKDRVAADFQGRSQPPSPLGEGAPETPCHGRAPEFRAHQAARVLSPCRKGKGWCAWIRPRP